MSQSNAVLHKLSISLFLILSWSGTPTFAQSTSEPIACDVPYEVVRGDTLADIAIRAYGSNSADSFYELNRDVIGDNPNLILVGMQLNVPCALDTGLLDNLLEADFSAAPEIDQAQTSLPDQTETSVPDESETSVPDQTLAPGTIQLVFNKAAAPNFILNVGIIDEYLAQITEVTDGRVTFIDPAQIERDPRQQYDLVLSGAVDGAYVFNGYIADRYPLLQLPMQALMGGTAQQTALALWHLHEQYLSQTDYIDDVQLMGFVGAPAAHIWRLREIPVTAGENIAETNEYTVPYFDGLDTRGAAAVQEENAAWLAEYDNAQGPSMVMAHGAALAGGIWKDNNRTVTEIKNGVYTPTFSVILNKESWNSISADDRAEIQAISGEQLARRSGAWDAFDNGLRIKMIDMGLEAVSADNALLSELQDQSRIGLESWMAAADAKGISGFEAVNDYIDTLQSLNPESR